MYTVPLPAGSTPSLVPACPVPEAPELPLGLGRPLATQLRPEFLAQPPSLLGAVGIRETDRVLILGRSCLEVLCEAVRHGCRSASEARTPPKRPEPSDVVVAPRVTSESDALAIAECGQKALIAGGHDGALGLVLVGDHALSIAQSITHRLRDQGFRRIRLKRWVGDQFLLVCNFGPIVIG